MVKIDSNLVNHIVFKTGKQFLTATLIIMISACNSGDKEKSSTQIAAKVNNDEISVHQLNLYLSRSGVTDPAASKTVGKKILTQLIDQALIVQQAKEQKLDRDPNILLAIEDAKRQVLTQAWIEKEAIKIAKPTPQEISEFYKAHPELFSKRKIYQLKELLIDANGANQEPANAAIKSSKTIDELAANLEKQKIPIKPNLTVQPAENMPMDKIVALSALKNGEFISFPKDNKVLAIGVASTKEEPLDETKANRFIENYLIAGKKKSLIDQTMARLRQTAKVEYKGEFAYTTPPATEPTNNALSVPQVPVAQAPTNPGSAEVEQKSAINEPAPTEQKDFINKGVSGLN